MRSSLFVFLLFIVFSSCNTKEVKETAKTFDNPIDKRIYEIGESLKKTPRKADLFFERAQLYTKKEYMEEALTDYVMAIKLDSTKPQYYLSITEFFVQTGNIQKAIDASEIAANLDLKNPIYFVNAGKCCLYLKQYQNGITFLNRAIERDKFNPEAYLYKGIIYKESNNLDKALNNFITASEQDPTWDAPFQQIGMIYADQKNDLAIKYFDNAYKANSKNTEVLYQKGLYYKDTHRDEKAKVMFREMIAANPQSGKTMYAMGILYFDEDSIQKALSNFDLCVQVEQTYYKGYYMQGQCLEKLNKKEAAKAAYNKCLTFKDDFELAKEAIKKLK